MQQRILIIVAILGLSTATLVAASPILRWAPSDTLVSEGDQLTLSVMLPVPVDVRTIELRIDYDPAVITSLDGGPGALFDGFSLFDDFTDDGQGSWYGYCVVLGAGDWATGPGELFQWTVAAADTGASLLETVSLTLLPPGGGDYPEAELPTDRVRVDVPVVGAPETAPVLPELSLYPNPFNPRTRIELVLPGGGSGRLEVLDLRGRVVSRPWRGVLPDGGTIAVDWIGRGRDDQPLPSGVYTFRLLAADGRVAWTRGVLIR